MISPNDSLMISNLLSSFILVVEAKKFGLSVTVKSLNHKVKR